MTSPAALRNRDSGPVWPSKDALLTLLVVAAVVFGVGFLGTTPLASTVPPPHRATQVADIAAPAFPFGVPHIPQCHGRGRGPSCGLGMIGSSGADYAYDLPRHNASAEEKIELGVTLLATVDTERGPPAQVFNDVGARLGAEGEASLATITGPDGIELPGVPDGATGVPTDTGKGLTYEIPEGTPGLNSRVTSIRVMEPVTTGPYQYENGYVSYMNKLGQTVNPLTGQTVAPNDPFAHIPLPPR